MALWPENPISKNLQGPIPSTSLQPLAKFGKI